MARYNEILEGRYNRLLQKLLAMKGGPPAPQLASELMAIFPLFHGRENRYLEEWRTFGVRVTQGAVAAQDTVVRFHNPPASNVIAVIESIKLDFSVANAGAFLEHAPTATGGSLGGTFVPASFDSRWQPPGSGQNGAQLVASAANNIGQGSRQIFDEIALAVAGNTSNDLINYDNQEFTILPNADFQIRSFTLQVAMDVTVRWRERLLGESERT